MGDNEILIKILGSMNIIKNTKTIKYICRAYCVDAKTFLG